MSQTTNIKEIKTRIQNKHDTEANWNNSDLVALQGELIIYDVDETYDYERLKIGDGETPVKDLPFANATVDQLTYTNTDPIVTTLGGISAGTTFDKVPINEVLTSLLYPYTKPVLSNFTLNPAAGVYEKGTAKTLLSASVNVTKKSKAISRATLYKGSEKLKSIDNPTVTSSGSTISFSDLNDNVAGTSNVTYYVKVSEKDGTVDVVSTSATYTFVDPYYYGVISPDTAITASVITDFEKGIRTKGSHSKTYTTNNQKPVIAYPQSYGELRSITDAALPYTWDKDDVVINGVNYYVYVGSASTLTNTYNFTY